MEHNVYLEQILMQQKIQHCSMLLSAVCLLAALLVLTAGRPRKRKKAGRRTVLLAAVVILLAAGSAEKVSAAETAGTRAEIQLIQGQSAGSGYDPPVVVQVRWWTAESAESRDPLRIEYSTGLYSESIVLDPGYGTSVSAQLAALGISWTSLTGESGVGETEEGKTLQFLVSESGTYRFSSAGSVMNFSVGNGAVSDDSGTAEAVSEETVNQTESGYTAGEENSGSGSEEEKEQNEDLTADQTAPKIKLIMSMTEGSGGELYAEEKTMKIQVKEEHFDISQKPEVVADVKKGYQFSGWKLTDAGAEGTLTFRKDGIYSVSYQCTDLAGNQSEEACSGTFILDRTKPDIKIRGVEQSAAYSTAVSPVVQIEDVSLCTDQLACTLRGAKAGILDVEQLSDLTLTEKGAEISFSHFPSEQDDVYTLSVTAVDQAGNSADEEVTFSIDQYGSSYIVSDETQALIDSYYTSDPVDLVLSEINTSPVIYQIALSKDGVPAELEEGEDYSVEVRGGDGEWMIYVYRIYASNFTEEGVYHVDITSRDQASNVNNSQERGMRIDFAVDRTPPAVLVGNLEDGARYYEEQHAFTIRTSDAARLSALQVLVNGEIFEQVDDPEEQVTVILEKDEEPQTIQILAEDTSGNQIRSEEYTVTVRPQEASESSVHRNGWILLACAAVLPVLVVSAAVRLKRKS